MVVKRWALAVIATFALLFGVIGVGLVAAQGPNEATPVAQDEAGDEAEDANEGADVAITGTALERASAAALAHTGEGRVTDTEVGDEEGYYEIEVTLDNGQQVDVHLDENFNILGTDADGNTDTD